MLHRLLDHVVKAFGREVIEQWIPLERLNITSVTDPEITLTNVPLPDKLFEDPSIPITVVKSNVGRVVIRCPWKTVFMNDGSVSLQVEVHDVDAIVRFKRINEWNVSSVKDALVKVREKLLRKWNSVVSSLGLLSTNSGKKGSKAAGVLNSLDITIHNVKVLLADNLLYDEPFSITIEAECVRGVGMRPDDPTLSEYEQQGVEDSMLNALWFTSSGVQMWLAIYHQDQDEMYAQQSDDGQENLFDHSDWKAQTKTEPSTVGKDSMSRYRSNSIDIDDEFPSRSSSHSSDDLFAVLSARAERVSRQSTRQTNFWNFCSAPCNDDSDDYHSEFRAQKVKPEDATLMRFLQGPYKNYNITPPQGLTFDMVLKMWNIVSIVGMPNIAQQKRRVVQVSLRTTEKGDTDDASPPTFDGKMQFEPLDLIVTSSAAKIVYNIVRYMQLTSVYRTMAMDNINAVPDPSDCQKFVDIIRTSQWTHREEDEKFVKEFELTTPFHLLLKLKEMANATKKRLTRVNACFISAPCLPDSHQEEGEQQFVPENIVQSYTWYQRDMSLMFVLPNVNVYVVPIDRGMPDDTLPSTVFQFSTFAFEYETLYLRATCRVLACKPILRCGHVMAVVKRRSFSAKIMLRPLKDSERLLCYPEHMITNLCPFFAEYGSDNMESCINGSTGKVGDVVRVTLEKYANDVKHIHIVIPKVVVILNSLLNLNAIIGEEFWRMQFLTFERFLQSSEKHGCGNPELSSMLFDFLKVTHSKTVSKVEFDGVIVRTALKKTTHVRQTSGGDEERADNQQYPLDLQNVCDRFIMNDKTLNTWEYCDDMDDPFAFKHTSSSMTDSSLGWADGGNKTVYGKAEFVSEMDAVSTDNANTPIYMFAQDWDPKLSVKSRLVLHLGKLRKWYRNTSALETPLNVLNELQVVQSLHLEVNDILVSNVSTCTLTYCSIGSVALSGTDHRGAAIQLLSLEAVTLAKKMSATCVDVEKLSVMFDAKLPLFTLLLRHVNTFKLYGTYMDQMRLKLKAICDMQQQHVTLDITLSGNPEICHILRTDLYDGSPDVLEECNANLVHALERKLQNVGKSEKVLFFSAGAIAVNLAAESILYELWVHKTQLELCGRERIKLYVGNTYLSMREDGTRTVMLSSKQSELGKDVDVTIDEVDYGQVMLDFRGKDAKYVNLEVRNVHHIIDLHFIKSVTDLVKQFKEYAHSSTPKHVGNISGHIMIHHSSVHHGGVGAIVDLFATVKLSEPENNLRLFIEIPRFHVTFTTGLSKRVFALSLLDVVLEMCQYRQRFNLRSSSSIGSDMSHEVKLMNVIVEIAHCAVWGFHLVAEGSVLKHKFKDINDAAENLQMVLHESWFNHMTAATLPSYYDDVPVVVVPLISTRYADASRLTPLLNANWIKDWLMKAAQDVDPNQCDTAADSVIEAFTINASQQRKRSLTKITVSLLTLDDILMAIGSVDLISLTAVFHRESINNLLELFSQCKLLRSGPRHNIREVKAAKIVKVDFNIDEIDLICPHNVDIDYHSAIPSALLPNVLVNAPMHKRRPKNRTSSFHILRIYSSPSVLLQAAATTTVMAQSNLTLQLVRMIYNNMKYLQGLTRYALFDYVDAMEDARYQASLHLFDAHNDERKGEIFVIACHKLNTSMYSPSARVEYWMDVVKHVAEGTVVTAQDLYKDFKSVLTLEMSNLNVDVRMVSNTLDAVKATIQHIQITDACGKNLVEDLCASRTTLGELGYLEDTTFCYPADQVNVSLTRGDGIFNIKVILEHTRSEIQIDGISVILGVVQDLGLFNLKRDKTKEKRGHKLRMNLEIGLNLHEIWLYHSIPKDVVAADPDGENVVPLESIKTEPSDTFRKSTLPRVLKRAREVEYKIHKASSIVTNEPGNQLLHDGNVIGCLVSISISYSKSGNSNLKLKYMGVALAKLNLMQGIKVLVDEHNDCIFSSLDSDDRNLFEVRESCVKSKVLENGHVVVAFEASKPKFSINVDQLFQLCLLKPYIVGTAIDTLKAHRILGQVSKSLDVQEEAPTVESYDLLEAIRYIATKYKLPMSNPTDMQGSIYNVKSDVDESSIYALQVRERGHAVITKIFNFINKLIWHDDDPQLTVSLLMNDCKCALFSVKNELVLTFNLQQLMFDLTHTAPVSKRRTVISSSMIFNVTTYNSSIDNHETVLQTTVATLKVTYEDVAFTMPALDINMQLSGVSVEVNPCLLQLFKQLKHVSLMLSSEQLGGKVNRRNLIKLYNELEVGVSLLGNRGGQRKKIELMHLPTQRFTNVTDKEIYIFLTSKSVKGAKQPPRNTLSGQFEALNGGSTQSGTETLSRERENLLLGNSVNVKRVLTVLHGHDNASEREIDINAITQAYPNLSMTFVGKYQLEQTGSRLFKLPDSLALVLMEQFTEEGNDPYVILSSSIRIQNSTDIPLCLRMDNKIGYFTNVAYKLTQHSKPSGNLEEMYLEPYSSSCVPLSWFGTAMMPTIAPILSKDYTASDAIPFQYLYDLLNRNPVSESDVEPIKEVTLRLKGVLALKCTIITKEAASTDDCGACLNHFTLKIEPMVKLVNMLPCDVDVSIALNRIKHRDDIKGEYDEYDLNSGYKSKVRRRLKRGETFGIPFSDQKIFIRLYVVGTQLKNWNGDQNSVAGTFEYFSPTFQVHLPSTGSVSINKTLRMVKGTLDDLMQKDNVESGGPVPSYADQYKSMTITIDLSRHYIRLWWPFIFENMSSSSLIINGRLLSPRTRYYGNLYEASNCRIRAIMSSNQPPESGNYGTNALSQCVKLDVTSTTDFRPPIKFVIPLNKRAATQMLPSQSIANNDEVLAPVVNAINVHVPRRYVNHPTTPEFRESLSNCATEEFIKSAEGDATVCNEFLCLGSTVRYAEYPYDMCKIVSITNMYTFVNRLPFTVCVRGAPINYPNVDTGASDGNRDVIIPPGESDSLNAPFQGAYVVNVESDISSGIFSLQYPRVPHVFQLELNSKNVTYSTVATRGLLVQVNVISGMFKGSSLPYSYNGYYFVLSLPKKPQYQILNLTNYTLAYSVPGNMKSPESQNVDSYDTAEQTWYETPMNKIGILPPTCITHYVPVANGKPNEAMQVCIKVIQVDKCDWSVQQLDTGREGYRSIKFTDQGKSVSLYATIIIRANGTRIVVMVGSKLAAIELNRIGGSAMSNGPILQWSSINFNFLTPRITITLSTKRKVILAFHLTNTSIAISIAPTKPERISLDARDSLDSEAYRSNMIEFIGIIQSIHIDHFLQGHIPVILKSSAKRSSSQESFLHFRLLLSNFMALGLPVYELIQAKLSPLSINIETAVIEQLLDSVEHMFKMPGANSTVESKRNVDNNLVVMPEPKWVEMQPTLPVYIRKLTVEPITLSLAIRTSSVRLTHHTMRILDALPLDTPCVCVHFAREARSSLIVGWSELMHSLRNSYLRQLIRQSLPSAWLSNTFAILHGFIKGVLLLVVQPVQTAVRFKSILEGSLVGMGNGIMLFLLYIAGGTTQSLGHILNVFHKIFGGQRSKPQGILDALWLGLNALFIHVFYLPWKRLITDFSESNSTGDGFLKTSGGLAINIIRCAVSPLIGVVNMLITIVEGFSNVLLGDFEQFTHVYESDQLVTTGNTTAGQQPKQTESRENSSSENYFLNRMKTSMVLKRKAHSKL
ncbi:uncharacterized protein BXIN_2689 [Babesia sp. Xinjiang]|uniref:uncharacterized protein n=1 Tax=Babesia sp. Xinjiang TaxID=462227 RepID=UPI000A2244E5|nr:uncharacterized protein BXIN_2631 [Babesia sp. Xinjiang]XP_028872077.1 uncharacterized protein BXIN_2689 [Babesia sp. Xinjiang]ORM41593.1 hypothetical protein BXIN_2631 [Babesia sp. Xinjiang]ORM41621.1 hypothetical protein BXIN_2689 [Babesia sp. Xinjiang]